MMGPQAAAMLLVLLPAAAGCAFPLKQGDAVYTVGVVKTSAVQDCTTPASPCYAVGSKSEHYGLRVGDGVGVGYYARNQVAVPLDCRVVILVQNQEQFDHAIRVYRSELDKGDLCTALKRD